MGTVYSFDARKFIVTVSVKWEHHYLVEAKSEEDVIKLIDDVIRLPSKEDFQVGSGQISPEVCSLDFRLLDKKIVDIIHLPPLEVGDPFEENKAP
jgi:hypothetical protein